MAERYDIGLPVQIGYRPLSKLAKATPYSAEYLSLRARQGKLKAKKVNGVWCSTENDIKHYIAEQVRNNQKKSHKLEKYGNRTQKVRPLLKSEGRTFIDLHKIGIPKFVFAVVILLFLFFSSQSDLFAHVVKLTKSLPRVVEILKEDFSYLSKFKPKVGFSDNAFLVDFSNTASLINLPQFQEQTKDNVESFVEDLKTGAGKLTNLFHEIKNTVKYIVQGKPPAQSPLGIEAGPPEYEVFGGELEAIKSELAQLKQAPLKVETTVVERTIEKIISELTEAEVDAKLNQVNTALLSQIINLKQDLMRKIQGNS